MAPLLIYTQNTSARLVYVLDWLFGERLGIDYRLVQEDAKPGSYSFAISYGIARPDCLSIPDAGLLWQNGVEHVDIISGAWKGVPTLFHKSESAHSVPFDLFSAIFFLLSRYEEYYPFIPDRHNRYPPQESVLYHWLDRPIVDEWIGIIKRELINAGVSLNENPFSFLPTYDIDIAWSYKYKGVARTIGASVRDLVKGNSKNMRTRFSVLSGKTDDPYDSFSALERIHQQNAISPVYFILAALRTTAFDKNIPPSNLQMRSLTQRLAEKGTVGIHPSYYTGERPEQLTSEKRELERIIDAPVTISRQHYIKLHLPATYHTLLANNITDDYSMGYGSKSGFRAGTGCSFLWYDLSLERPAPLRIHPFCFMDTTAHYDEGLTSEQAFLKLDSYANILQQTNSRLVTVFHNFSLGTDKEWKGWRELYEKFIACHARFFIS